MVEQESQADPFLDTEGALAIDRIFKAAQALMRDSSSTSKWIQVKLSAEMTVDPYSIVEGVHLIRVATQVQMIALLQTLDDWLESHPKVGDPSVDPPFAGKVD